MLLHEYKLQAIAAQRAAIEETIRITPCIRTSCLRVWRDERGGRGGGGGGGGGRGLQRAVRPLGPPLRLSLVAPPTPPPPPPPPLAHPTGGQHTHSDHIVI